MNRLPRATLVAALAGALCACHHRDTRERPAPAPAVSSATASPSAPAAAPPSAERGAADAAALPTGAGSEAPAAVVGPLRFIAIGGGYTPESNEVSLEQDIDLVRRALPAPGLVLFAGGSNAESVRELAPTAQGDPVKVALGELFSPRPGRRSRYRAPRFAAERATLQNVEARLAAALAERAPPLIVHIAAHGERGQEARDNSVALWAGGSLSVAHLAELHERYRRGLRLVATSCFSGGFADLAFSRADARVGRPARVPRCGLFAGTWDRETSGCDPNPDRRAQESYGLHFVSALAGRRKDGTDLGVEAADYDHDGQIGLLDAHTWASIEAVSFDVPTTTSERWVRHASNGSSNASAPIDKALLPEQLALTEQLGARLGLRTEQAALQRWQELARGMDELNTEVDAAEDALRASETDESTLLLEQWPVLDDPFHPDFDAAFDNHRREIEAALTASPEARAREAANARSNALYARLQSLQLEEARVMRLSRAYETLHRASALLRRGGAAARYYTELLACERAPVASPQGSGQR